MRKLDWQQIKDIFALALEQPGESRADFLRESCGDDVALYQEVQSLLDANDEGNNLIESNALDLASRLESTSNTYDGREFGRYRILRELGHGGMGTVFLAERTDGEFDQQVALKIVRQTIADSETEKRFRRERQILAALNHPNIASLHDGGVSENGEPFLVMEYIEGEPLVEFAENHDLKIEERLRLFLKICTAVSYAHRNLIIHRDIKPSNILVTKDGEPKLLDFGLAKILDEQMSDGTQTETAFRAFTPSYASLEQIRGKNITTASDVYSLGVVLYELLTNERPFKTDDKSFDEILRQITEAAPRKPSEIARSGKSKRLTTSGDENKDSMRNKSASTILRISPSALRGDLDNIVMMAMRKEPERRYSSAEQFAQDIERHLNHLPIAARSNTFNYRASKFFARNRVAVIAAALILISVFTGLTIAFRQYQQAQHERAKANEISAFLQKILLTASPQSFSSDKKGYSTTINDVLGQATKRLESQDFANQPEVKADLQQIIGQAYASQGQYELGEKYLRAALLMQTALYDASSLKILQTRLFLGDLFFAKANYDEAESIYKPSLPIVREEVRNGNIESPYLKALLNNYALLRRARGDSRTAELLLRESLSVSSLKPSEEHDNSFAETLLTLTLLDQGKFDEAETLTRKQVEAFRQMPNKETLPLSNSLTLLGSILMEKGSLTEASASLREAERIYRKLLSPNSIAIYDNIRLQAQVSYLAGNYSEADKQISQVLDNYRQNSNPKYISFVTAMTVQGLILNKLKKHDEAEQVLREALRLRTENLPARHFMTALTKGALGEVRVAQKKFDEGEQLLKESYEDLKLSQVNENQRTLTAKRRLVELYHAWNKPDLSAAYQ